MARGGCRQGAGRKSLAEELAVLKYLDASISEQDWVGIFTRIKEKALEGSLPHAEALLNRKFGKPTEEITTESQYEQPRINLNKVPVEILRELEKAKYWTDD